MLRGLNNTGLDLSEKKSVGLSREFLAGAVYLVARPEATK
jgi:hypothetical protein